MHIGKNLLAVGGHELELNSLEGIQTVRPPHGRAPFTVVFHRNGWKTVLPAVPLVDIDNLFCEAPAHLKKGWTPIYDAWGDRGLLNPGILSTRPCQRGALDAIGGQTEIVNTVHPEIYRVGLQYQHRIFISCILPAAMAGRGWNASMPAPLAPVFSPVPEDLVRFGRRSAVAA